MRLFGFRGSGMFRAYNFRRTVGFRVQGFGWGDLGLRQGGMRFQSFQEAAVG